MTVRTIRDECIGCVVRCNKKEVDRGQGSAGEAWGHVLAHLCNVLMSDFLPSQPYLPDNPPRPWLNLHYSMCLQTDTGERSIRILLWHCFAFNTNIYYFSAMRNCLLV